MALWVYLWAWSGITKWLYHLDWNANDSSGNSANGTATNVTWQSWKIWTNSALFNWTNSYIQCTDWYSWSGSYCIMWYFNSTVAPTSWDYNLMFRYSDSSWYDTMRVYYWWWANNTITWKWCTWTVTDANNVFNISINPSTNTWHHYAFVIDDTNKYAKFYFNWNFHSQQSFTWNASKSTRTNFYFTIWNRFYSPNECWSWWIDEIICQQSLLNASDIKKYYTYSKGWF